MDSEHKTSSRQQGYILALVISFLLHAVPAKAIEITWICNNYFWSVTTCWDPAGPPPAGSDVLISGDNQTVYLNVNTGGLNTLTLDATGGGTAYLDQLFIGGEMHATTEYIGYDGRGVYQHSTGLNAADTVYVGYHSGSSGRYELRGTAELSAINEYIGYWIPGTATTSATFNQNGGTNTIADSLYVGYVGGNSSRQPFEYILLDGVLTSGNEYLGYRGEGSFRQLGGTNTVSDELILGYDSHSYGYYQLDAGQLTTNTEIIAYSGDGKFQQNGGTHIVNDTLYISMDRTAFSAADYELNGGSLQATNENIGYVGRGVFTHTGGEHTVSNDLVLGTSYRSSWFYDFDYGGYREDYTAGTGVYNLTGSGGLTVFDAYIGRRGVGTFNQDAGVVNVTHALHLGSVSYRTCRFLQPVCNDHAGYGTYNLNGGVLHGATEFIGNDGIGVFNQHGGTHGITGNNTIYLGYDENGQGTYNLNNGALSAAHITVGERGDGTFNQINGNNTITHNLFLGSETTGTGTYNLNGADSNLSTNYAIIGRYGEGHFVQNGGTNTVASGLYLGFYESGNGLYELNAGTLTAASAYIGHNGTGHFIQHDGTNTVDGAMFIANRVGGESVYELQGGSLQAGTLQLLNGGTFRQSAGTLNAAVINQDGGKVEGNLQNHGIFNYTSGEFNGRLLNYGELNIIHDSFVAADGMENYSTFGIDDKFIALQGSGLRNDGAITMASGILSVASNETIGAAGDGSMLQTGGSHEIANWLTLGQDAGSQGDYFLHSGLLTAYIERIGYQGNGRFQQTLGANLVSYLVTLGYDADSTGEYMLYDRGHLHADYLEVGRYGRGVFRQDNGVVLLEGINATLSLADYAGSTGTYQLNGGTLTAGYKEIIGASGTGAFTQTGGENSVTGMLALGAKAGAEGTYTLLNGNLSARTVSVGGDGTGAGNEGVGSFTQSGGVVSISQDLIVGNNVGGSGSYVLSGSGQIIANNESIGRSGFGIFTQTGGQNSAAGTIVIAENTGSMGTYNMLGGTLAATQIINNDTFNYSGGSVNANLTNNADVHLSGPGTRTVTGDVTNYGNIKVSDTTAVFTGSFTNHGAYISDPSASYFADLIIAETGYLIGGAGDRFYINGNFTNNSLQYDLWNTAEAYLGFTGAGTHEFSTREWLADEEYLWGTLELLDGGELSLNGSALYLDTLILSATSNLFLDGITLYYTNLFDYGGAIDFAHGGQLVAWAPSTDVPEPSALVLLLMGLCMLIYTNRNTRATGSMSLQ